MSNSAVHTESPRLRRPIRRIALFVSAALAIICLATFVPWRSAFGLPEGIVRAQGATLDLSALGLEVTQGLQSLDASNPIRLVADKRTFVRFYVLASGGEARTTAVLRATTGGQTVTLNPINPGAEINVVADPDRTQRDAAFLFELPDGFRRGTVTLEAEVNPELPTRARNPVETSYTNNRTTPFNFQFEVVPPLNLIIYNLGYRLDGVDYYAPDRDLELMVSWMSRAWPVSQINYRFLRDFIDTGGQLPDCREVNRFLLAKRTLDLQNTSNPTPENTRYYGMVSDNGDFMRGCASGLPGFASSGPSGVPRSNPNSLLGNWDTDGSYGDWYGAHEVAHNMARYHVEFCDAKAGRPFPNPDGSISPLASGLGAVFGFDIGTGAVYGPDWKDNMTYCRLQWISNFTYHGLMDAIQQNVLPESFPVHTLEYQREQTPQDRFMINGNIHPAAGNQPARAELDPLFLVPNSRNVTFPISGAYAIVLRNAAGTELSRTPFAPDAVIDEDDIAHNKPAMGGELSINEMIPFVAGVARVEVVGPNAQVLGSLTAGPGAPRITVTTPASGAALNADGGITLRWTASDPDNDPLTFTIQYTANNGQSWETVDSDVTGTDQVDIDAADLRSGAQARFRVLVSDGINNASADSGTFVVPNHPPTIHILEPVGDITIGAGQTLALEGAAYDVDAGTVPDSQLTWTSSLDGLLGHRAAVHTAGLRVGVHTITFSADDGSGGVISASLQVTVTTAVPPAASALYFPRLVNRGNQLTGLAVANPGRSAAKITFTAYNNDGTVIASGANNPATRSMASGNQVANLAFEILGAGLDTAGGWIKVASDVPGLTGFFLAFDSALNTMDGTDVTDRLMTGFQLGELQNAEISMVNPGTQPAATTISLVNNSGQVVGTQQTTIPPNGRFSNRVSNIFAAALVDAGGYLRVTSSPGLAATEVFGTDNYIAALNAFDVAGGAKLLYSPQFVVQGGVWKSTLTILNLENAPTQVTLALLSDSGAPIGQAVTLTLLAGERRVIADPSVFGIAAAGPLVQGYVKITSRDTRVAGYVRFGDPGDRQFQTALPFVTQGRMDVIYSQIAQDSQFFTGVAVINANDSAASVTVSAFDTGGVLVGSGHVTLAPNARISKLLPELIPKLPPMTKGYFRVTADKPVYSFAVFGTNTLSVLSAAPPQPLVIP